jgi:hypothetical protein
VCTEVLAYGVIHLLPTSLFIHEKHLKSQERRVTSVDSYNNNKQINHLGESWVLSHAVEFVSGEKNVSIKHKV